MIYHHSSVRSFASHYLACASLVVLTLWVMIDIIFVKFLAVCGEPHGGKNPSQALQCDLLHYRVHSVWLKTFDTQYAPAAFLGRAFAVYDEFRHNLDHACGKTLGGAAKAANCKPGTVGVNYAKAVALLLFYVWGPLVVFWLLLKRLFTRKVNTYAAH